MTNPFNIILLLAIIADIEMTANDSRHPLQNINLTLIKYCCNYYLVTPRWP